MHIGMNQGWALKDLKAITFERRRRYRLDILKWWVHTLICQKINPTIFQTRKSKVNLTLLDLLEKERIEKNRSKFMDLLLRVKVNQENPHSQKIHQGCRFENETETLTI